MRIILIIGVFVLGIAVVSQTMDERTEAQAPHAALLESADEVAELADIPSKICYEDGVLRVGIQVGHWKADELPDELENLRFNYGASAAGYNERDVMLELGETVKADLETHGIAVDLLPATIPANYCADLFLSLHADGNETTSVRGYKVAASSWDTGRGAVFASLLQEAYGEASNLPLDPAISDDMYEYYAFNYGKFVHSVDEDTPSVILETGFLTNSQDRSFLVNRLDTAAGAISSSILSFLN